MKVLIELLHIALGLMAAVAIASLSVWSYPQARNDIWLVALVIMAAILAMGVGPLKRVMDQTDAERAAARGSDDNG